MGTNYTTRVNSEHTQSDYRAQESNVKGRSPRWCSPQFFQRGGKAQVRADAICSPTPGYT